MSYKLTKDALKEAIEEKIAEVWQSGGAGREALREELRKYVVSNAVRRSWITPESRGDIACFYPLSETEAIYTDAVNNLVRRINIETGDIRWTYNLETPLGVDYYPDEDIVAVANFALSGGVTILNAENGTVIKTITSIPLGSFGSYGVWDVSFDDSDPDYIYFTVPSRHILLRYNRVTDAYTMFGIWNTSKTDFTGLKTPTSVDVDSSHDLVLVADYMNNRVLRLPMDISSVQDLILLNQPQWVRFCRWGLIHQRAPLTVISSAASPNPMYTFAYRRSRRIEWVIPVQSDAPRFAPDFMSLWVTGGGEAVEYDLDRLKELYLTNPCHAFDRRQQSVTTSGYNSPPHTPFLFGKEVQVFLYSNQKGDIDIQVPDNVDPSSEIGNLPMSVPTTFSWVSYFSEPTPKGVYVLDLSPNPPPVFRINYVPEADATVTLRVDYSGGI